MYTYIYTNTVRMLICIPSYIQPEMMPRDLRRAETTRPALAAKSSAWREKRAMPWYCCGTLRSMANSRRGTCTRLGTWFVKWERIWKWMGIGFKVGFVVGPWP